VTIFYSFALTDLLWVSGHQEPSNVHSMTDYSFSSLPLFSLTSSLFPLSLSMWFLHWCTQKNSFTL
jgi:hypothetical protein